MNETPCCFGVSDDALKKNFVNLCGTSYVLLTGAPEIMLLNQDQFEGTKYDNLLILLTL